MTNLQTWSRGIIPHVLTLVASTACLSGLGCASDDTRDPSKASLAQAFPVAPRLDAGTAAPYVATITANGTGCPPDRWDSNVSADGHTITTSFDSFEAEVQDGARIAFKDCNLTMKLHSAAPLSYAVRRYTHAGATFLESGVRGFISANYYFRGNAASASTEQRLDFTGPTDFCFAPTELEPIRDADLVWSPCGHDNTLTVVNRIGLQKTQDAGAGYIDLCDVDTECGGPFKLGLIWRACSEDASDAGASSPARTGSIDAAMP